MCPLQKISCFFSTFCAFIFLLQGNCIKLWLPVFYLCDQGRLSNRKIQVDYLLMLFKVPVKCHISLEEQLVTLDLCTWAVCCSEQSIPGMGPAMAIRRDKEGLERQKNKYRITICCVLSEPYVPLR